MGLPAVNQMLQHFPQAEFRNCKSFVALFCNQTETIILKFPTKATTWNLSVWNRIEKLGKFWFILMWYFFMCLWFHVRLEQCCHYENKLHSAQLCWLMTEQCVWLSEVTHISGDNFVNQMIWQNYRCKAICTLVHYK